MANTIRIKRSASTNTPTSLAQGELANSESGSPNGVNELFIGTTGPAVTKLIRNLNGAPAEPTAGLAGATPVTSDYVVFEDVTDGQAKRNLFSATPLSIFNNDAGYTSNAGTVTSVASGNGMNFTTITGTGTVTMGTPGTLSTATTNATTATSHTHAITVSGSGTILASQGATLTGQFNCADNTVSRPVLLDYGVTHQVLTITTNAATFDCTLGNSGIIDLQSATGTVTLTFSNPPASGTYGEFVLFVQQGTVARTITWPGSVDWKQGGAPTLSTTDNVIDIVSFSTIDGGTTWLGTYVLDAGGAGGTVTSVSGGVGIVNTGTASDPVLDLDFSELTDMTASISGTTEFILQNGTTESRKTANEIGLQFFDNATSLFISESDTSTTGWGFVIDEDTMVSNLATKVPTQQSVKAYVDNAVSSALTYQGGYNAATNTPDLDVTPSGITTGDTYTVTADGNFFTEAVQTGDMLIANQNNPTLLSHWTVVQDNIGAASETAPGYIEIATQAEVNAAASTVLAVVPAYLHATTFDGGTF